MFRCDNETCCQCNCTTEELCDRKNDSIETSCSVNNKCSCNQIENTPNMSGCGFQKPQSVFPTNPMLGQSYVPIQYMNKTFTPMCGLKNGTLFPELVNTYYPGQSMMDIDYLRMSNNLGMEV